jgi:hypothetical protein
MVPTYPQSGFLFLILKILRFEDVTTMLMLSMPYNFFSLEFLYFFSFLIFQIFVAEKVDVLQPLLHRRLQVLSFLVLESFPSWEEQQIKTLTWMCGYLTAQSRETVQFSY